MCLCQFSPVRWQMRQLVWLSIVIESIEIKFCNQILCSPLCVLKVNQSTTPQPVEVCVCCLRATRDKLPRGLYTVTVALHSHLGGPALAWCSRKGLQQWAASSEPTEHRGRSCDIDLHINQSLFMVRRCFTKALKHKRWWYCNNSDSFIFKHFQEIINNIILFS